MKLEKIYGAGKSVRYHTDPWFIRFGQTIADHTWGMLAIIYKFNDSPSPDLLKTITFHDCGEYLCGDLPYPFKRMAPDLAAKHAEIEERVLEDFLDGPLPALSNEDKTWLVFADRLEAQCFMLMYMPELRDRKDWVQNYEKCLQCAIEFGIDDMLVDFLTKASKFNKEKWG